MGYLLWVVSRAVIYQMCDVHAKVARVELPGGHRPPHQKRRY